MMAVKKSLIPIINISDTISTTTEYDEGLFPNPRRT